MPEFQLFELLYNLLHYKSIVLEVSYVYDSALIMVVKAVKRVLIFLNYFTIHHGKHFGYHLVLLS